MLGGKQKFHGQSGFYEATMRGAVMKKVSGQRFQLDVLEELGLPVTHAMRARFDQIDDHDIAVKIGIDGSGKSRGS